MLDSSSGKSIIDLGAWLQTATGAYVRDWEQAYLNALTADIFGFHAVQIGLPQICTLQANRMPYRWLTDKHIPAAGAWMANGCGAEDHAGADQSADRIAGQDGPDRQSSPDSQRNAATPQAATLPGAEAIPVVVSHDFTELPFASQSLDLVILPHLLEFAAEPHQVLREVERVLIPEGQLIISGFNPASLWGARQAAGRLTGGPFLPRDGEFISLLRLKDWLKLLNMEVGRAQYGCYVPPCGTQKWLHRFGFLEPAGARWWPYFGAVYVVRAIKRVQGMRLVGPVWNKRPAAAARPVPAANRAGNGNTGNIGNAGHAGRIGQNRGSDSQSKQEKDASTDG